MSGKSLSVWVPERFSDELENIAAELGESVSSVAYALMLSGHGQLLPERNRGFSFSTLDSIKRMNRGEIDKR